MATSTAPPPQQVALLTQKLYDADSDIRYMSLNDLAGLFQSAQVAFLSQDVTQCSKTVDGFLNTLNDPNGEVQNLTIKCLGPFVLKASPEILSPLIQRIGSQTIDNTVDPSISAMALRTIVISLPRPSPGSARSKPIQDAYNAISAALIPRLVAQKPAPTSTSNSRGRYEPPPRSLLKDDLEKGTDSNSIDILIEVAKCFGPMLQALEVQALESTAMQLLESTKSGNVMKKKAVAAIAALAQYLSEPQLSSIVSYLIEALQAPHLTPANRRLYISLMGSLADAIPVNFGKQLKLVAPFVLSALSQEELDDQMADSDGDERGNELDEVREAALTTLESFLSSCPNDMERFNEKSLAAILRFLKYDPNMAMGSDDEAVGGQDEGYDDDFDADEDFEQDDAADDENDISWKVRRCAARTLRSMLAVKSVDLLESTTSFEPIAKGLLDRFKEREDAVRVEVLNTSTYMVRHCAQDDTEAYGELQASTQEPSMTASRISKKRRRDSDVSAPDQSNKRRLTGSISPPSESPVPPGAPANLAKIVPDFISGGLKLASDKALNTQIAAVTLLKEVILARRGGANDHLLELFNLITTHLDALPSAGIQTQSTLGLGSVHAEALKLLSEISKATTSSILQPLMAKAIPSVVGACKSRSPRIACEALRTLEQLAKALTPPRSASSSKQSASQVSQILDTVVSIACAKSFDLDTRKHAIAVLGTVLGRTLGAQGIQLISSQQRTASFDLMLECCKNETTRYATIKAIEALGTQAPDGVILDQQWFAAVTTELGNQLRKADRALRGASLGALRVLIADRKGSKNLADPTQLTDLLMPLLSSNDLHMIGPCLIIFAALIRDSASNIITPDFIKAFCALVISDNATNVSDVLGEVVQSAGRRGTGQPLMQALLQDVGVNGPPAVVGKLIGDLLTSSDGKTVGITLDAFLNELKVAKDDTRRCLALSVIGQVGLRSGKSASMSPELFTNYFTKSSSQIVPLAAAIALGRAAAGAGNAPEYVPSILSLAKSDSRQQYLAAHCIKEMLHSSEDPEASLPFKEDLWNAAVSASETEESKTVGAECLAILTALDPKNQLNSLQTMLAASSSSTRGTAIYAFRDLLSSTADDQNYIRHLKPLFIPFLTTMMRDDHPDNRKTALNTLGAAARHHPTFILPALNQLIPPILDQTHEDPALIREVSMGPFKHRVDDGLEARKSAYETIYTLLELSPPQLAPMIPAIYPRVVAGISGTGDHAIRSLCNHIILRLASAVPPEETVRILDDLADRFRSVLAVVLKDTAVRTEIEKTDEAKRASVKVAYQVQKRLAERGAKLGEGGVGARWGQFLEECRRDWAVVVKEVEREMKDGAGAGTS